MTEWCFEACGGLLMHRVLASGFPIPAPAPIQTIALVCRSQSGTRHQASGTCGLSSTFGSVRMRVPSGAAHLSSARALRKEESQRGGQRAFCGAVNQDLETLQQTGLEFMRVPCVMLPFN